MEVLEMRYFKLKPVLLIAIFAVAGLALASNMAGCRKTPKPAQQAASPNTQTAPPPQIPQMDTQDRTNPMPTSATWVYTDKLEYHVGEQMSIQYTIEGGATGKPWLCLVPTTVAAQDANSNATGNIGIVNLEEGAPPTGTVELPTTQKGEFYVRLFCVDADGAMVCQGQTNIIIVLDWQQGNLVGPTKPYVLLEGQQPVQELKPIPQIKIKAGTMLKGVYELAEAYPKDAWIGVIPASVQRRTGDSCLPASVWTKQLSDGALSGAIEFTIDKPGEYYLRLFPCAKGDPVFTFQSTKITVE
jgi:hypothetical protein